MILRTGKPPEPMVKAAKPNLVTRLGVALDVARGKQVDLSTWFGPLQPLAPVAPDEVAGRRFDFPSGFNIVTTPRGFDGTGEARVSFKQLRDLADGYDLMRLVIETRKDQLVKLQWQVRPSDEQKRKAGKPDARIAAATAFLEHPDSEHTFEVWLRALVEDLLVIDAATIYPRRTNGGDLYALELIDGATVKPVIDDHGRRPLPPAPAYQQVLKGLPAVDYRADELFYFPRNVRTGFVYGFPPVEQVIMTVNIAVRRQLHQLEFYTAGTVPDMLCPVPDAWSPDQIGEFQQYWDALLSNNTADRRRVRFVPSGIGKGAVQTKEAALKDDYDEWLARIVCYAFSVSPQWAVKTMNRATAEAAQEQALQEGLTSLQGWVKGVVDHCLAHAMGFPDLEFAWTEEDSTDPKEQSDIEVAYLTRGVKTINEVRADLGLDKVRNGDTPLIYTAGGAVTLESVLTAPITKTPQGAPGARPRANGTPQGQDKVFERSSAELNGSGAKAALAAGGKMAKADRQRPKLDRNRPSRRKAATALNKTFSRLFADEATRLAASAGALRPKLAKADTPSGSNEDDWLDAAAWDEAEAEARAVLERQAQEGVVESLAAIGLDDSGVTELANDRAVAWAKSHAADMISKIAETTRDELRALIVESESSGWSVAKLAKKIEDATAFSAERATLIAQHETRTADNQGSLEAWRAAKHDLGIAIKKRWQPRGANVCPACLANEAEGAIDVDENFASGAAAAPAHPRCECDTEPVLDDASATQAKE